MKLNQKEIYRIAQTNNCNLCEILLSNIKNRYISEKFLSKNPDLKTHLEQIKNSF